METELVEEVEDTTEEELNKDSINYTDEERELMSIMFRHMDDFLQHFDVYDFDRSDLYNLSVKLGIDY
jgi:hypothetical protein